jgi:glutamine amidotransferase
LIRIVDYGLGNVQAFLNIYKRLNIPAASAQTPQELATAERIVLPGVGAFDRAMALLQESGMRDTLDKIVLLEGKRVLGVCVGMQMMADRSEEGKLPGLGWISGEVARFEERSFNQRTHLPHMGWNDVEPRADDTLFAGIAQPQYYFLHSYRYVPTDETDILATTNYGTSFASALRRGQIFGTQFHPEKSHHWGVSLLANFAKG